MSESLGATRSGTSAFGTVLRSMRLAAGLSQAALAERAGLSERAVGALERGDRTTPRPATVVLLADALSASPSERQRLLAAAHADAQPTDRDQPTEGERPTDTGAASLARRGLLVPPTPLLGRQQDILAVRQLLSPSGGAARLLTLIGPGGVGKTRVALAVALELLDAFGNDVWFVDLSPLPDYRLVPATIARALDVRESGGRSARELLLGYLSERRVLLVLDNFEHLLEAAPVIADLVLRCPRLAALVTSRAALRVRGERRFLVAPLATPHAEADPAGQDIGASPAVQLFVARAQAVTSDFALTAGTAPAVAAICRRLDGLPLAIELAAARLGLLGPEALLGRLQHRLPLLTGGAVDLPERQRTLRGTLAWSHDLLEAAEQVLFRRLAVFAGGWTLEAAEAVCSGDDLPVDAVLEGLAALADHSLIQRTSDADGEPRLRILESIREYALELLTHSGEEASVRRAHAAHYLSLAERAEPELVEAQQSHWLAILEREHDNLRAALRWAANNDSEAGLRLAGAIKQFWWVHGHLAEGRRWLDELLACSPEGSEPAISARVRAKALNAAGNLAFGQADYQRARAMYEASLAVARTTADPGRLATALHNLGFAAAEQGDTAQAAALLEESLAVASGLDGPRNLAIRLTTLGDVVRQQGDLQRAQQLLLDAVAIFRRCGDVLWLESALTNLGHVARDARQWPEALAYYTQALQIGCTLSANYGRGLARCLEGLASVAIARKQVPRAVRLLGAASRLRETIGAPVAPAALTGHEQAVARARLALGEAAFAAAWAEGRAQTRDQAIAEALSLTRTVATAGTHRVARERSPDTS